MNDVFVEYLQLTPENETILRLLHVKHTTSDAITVMQYCVGDLNETALCLRVNEASCHVPVIFVGAHNPGLTS